jgi:hypothetical protein
MLYRHREVAKRRIETRQTHDASSGPLVRRRTPKELAVINDRRHVEPRDRVRMMNECKKTARPAEQIRIRAQRTEWNRHVRILQDEIAPGHKGREVARAGTLSHATGSGWMTSVVRSRTESKNSSPSPKIAPVRGASRRAKIFKTRIASSGHSRRCSSASSGKRTKVAAMTVSSPNVIEIKLDRVIDDMRFLRSQMIAFDRRLNGIEAYLKPSEQQPESKSTPWFAAAGRATARTALFAVGAAVGAALLYLGT